MSRFALEIETDNAAFEPYPGSEIGRILIVVASRIGGNPTEAGEGRIHDINGDYVGDWRITK